LEDFSSVGLNLIPDRAKSQSRAHILSVEMTTSIVGKTGSAPSLMQLRRAVVRCTCCHAHMLTLSRDGSRHNDIRWSACINLV
jgi:hypothetical protein